MILHRAIGIALLGFILSACGDANKSIEKVASASLASSSSSPSPTSRTETPPFKVALVLKTLTNPYFIEIEQGARRAEKEFGIALQVKTASQETAIEQQIQIVDELIESKVDALVIAPGDSKRVMSILKKAQSNGVLIINIDNPLDAVLLNRNQMQPITYVGVDNEEASYQVVKYAIENIKKPTQVAIIEGIPGADNARLRLKGAVRAFETNPAIRIVAKQSAHWKIDEAHEVAKTMLANNPEVSLLFCANDMMALGAIKYLQDSGRKNVAVIGYDALDEAKAAIATGAMVATVDQQAAEQGYQGIALAVRRLKGEAIPPVLMVQPQMVTAETLKQKK